MKQMHGGRFANFFTANIGMFMRNAAIYDYPGGMVQFYTDEGLIFSPTSTRTININLDPPVQIRLAPLLDASTNLGFAYTPNDPDNDNDLATTRIYGWAQNEGIDWFAIEDTNQRLVWIADFGIVPEPGSNDKSPERKIDNPLVLSPGRVFVSDDLGIILGD